MSVKTGAKIGVNGYDTIDPWAIAIVPIWSEIIILAQTYAFVDGGNLFDNDIYGTFVYSGRIDYKRPAIYMDDGWQYDDIHIASLQMNLGFLSDGFVIPGLQAMNIKAEVKPVPEPATMVLLGTGLAGLVGFRKKFKKY